MNTVRQVALLLESSTMWGSESLRGIADFVNELPPGLGNKRHPRWSVFIEPRGWFERLRLPAGWKGDGVIARITTPEMARELARARVPIVNMAYIPWKSFGFAQVTADEAKVGIAAAEHFLSRGYRHFAYCGPRSYTYYVDRCAPAFEQAVRGAGHRCAFYRKAATSTADRGWPAQRASLIRWLARLPKPVAVLTWNADRGRQVIDACHAGVIRVPEDVAVLSAEDDHVMAELSMPPLSCIDHGPRRIGYAAAELLQRMMGGSAAPKKSLLFAPLGVVARRSSDALAIEAGPMADAVRFIRDRFVEPVQVPDIAKSCGISRRSLEQQFLQTLGRSPAAELRRLRLERAQRLLSQTNLSIETIATASGFNHAEVMTRLFQRETGGSPSEFRRQSRLSRQGQP